MQGLQVLIDRLSDNRGLHISIEDLSGILDTPITRIAFENVIHTARFCNAAKSTPRGHETCMRCKQLAHGKAACTKAPFAGHCVYGLYEAVFPVLRNGSIAAIVYVGNAVADREETVARIHRACGRTGVDPALLLEAIERCEHVEGPTELMQIAELVSDYLKLLFESIPPNGRQLHWLVSLMKRYAEEMYSTGISLKELAITCGKNEKYLGRLFKKELGLSFSEYCNGLRLEKAEKMLARGSRKIIDIAMECGFNNVSYFNRVFKAKHGMSPQAFSRTLRASGTLLADKGSFFGKHPEKH